MLLLSQWYQKQDITLQALAKRKETCSKFAVINVPVLILVGKDDIIAPPEAAHSMH